LTVASKVANTHRLEKLHHWGCDSLSPDRLGGHEQHPLLSQERALTIDRIQARVNEQIRISPIRVISSDGTQLGIIPTDEALAKARVESLDLVEVAPNEKPPVCRIMDYGKYKYDKKKKAHQHGHHTKTKEIRLRPKTGQHDIGFKVKQAKGFLEHKDKVQVSVIFRGREMAHIEEGRRVMEGVIEELREFGKIEVPPQQHGRRMVCTIAPK
jgi:translation initiation factor IF-3